MKVAIDVSPLKSGHKTRGIGSYTQNLLSSLNSIDKNLQILEFLNTKYPPEANVIHYPYFDLFFHSLPNSSNIPRIVTIHDVIPLVFPRHFPSGIKGKINLTLQKRALKNTEAVICDSQASKNDIIEKLSYPANKIHVIYLAANNLFREINNSVALKKTMKKYALPENFVLYVGDVNWNKNLPNLLEAIKISNLNLVMVGNALTDVNLEQTAFIISLINKLGVKDKVARIGYVPVSELAVIYNLASVTISPSFYEGFGLPVLESMACGTPVICSNKASLPEVGGTQAIYCDPEDPKNISERIKEALSTSESEKGKISKKLIDHASSFSWQKTAVETFNVYKNVLNEN